jgi:mono/diheme cytochrome c family protein
MKRRNLGLFAVLSIAVGCLPDYTPSGLQRGGSSPGDYEGSYGGGGMGSSGPSGPTITSTAPDFGPTIRQSDPPPPLSGGTMAVARDGFTVVAADPDRDRVYLLDYRTASTLRAIHLSPHDEPGRVAIDGANRAHVALRNGGAIVTIDIATAAILQRRDVCSAPRGIAYEAATNLVHVACAGGELVALPAAGGAEIRRRNVARDLRDVVVVNGSLVVSTFRDAKVLRLDAGSDVAVERATLRSVSFGTPRVAWRMVAAPPTPAGGVEDVVIAAQKAPDSDDIPPPVPAQYYSSVDGCSANGPGPILMDRNEAVHVPGAVLPVDVAVNDRLMVLAAAGNAHTPNAPQLVFVSRIQSADVNSPFSCDMGEGVAVSKAQITSLAFANSGGVVVALSREPAALVVIDAFTRAEKARITLAPETREDTGHAIFHSNSGVGVACASCHPDGRDDGHAWRSVQLGARRTPSLLGTLANTAPYHWNGEAKDLSAIVSLTFESRMRGPILASDRVAAMDGWLQALRAPPASKPADAAAASRGKALFEAAASCATCHSGPMRTNNAGADVGTGGTFQVPSLIGVAWRAPHLHDGSAPSIRWLLERGHGGATRPAAEIGDLTSFVETF